MYIKRNYVPTSKLYAKLALKFGSEYFWKNPWGLITYTFWTVAVNKTYKSEAKYVFNIINTCYQNYNQIQHLSRPQTENEIIQLSYV